MEKTNREYIQSEKPLLDQLKHLGWEIIEHDGIPQDPSESHRETFRECVLKDIFEEKLQELNPWLTTSQTEDIYNSAATVNHKELFENNKEKTEYLQEVNNFKCTDMKTGEKNKNVCLISRDPKVKNHYLAISQFRVDTPGCAKEFIIPDIVLFVNGLPLVVIECKAPSKVASNPVEEGINQLLRYQNRRLNTMGEAEREGEEKLFHWNQFVISTDGDEARVGTISSDYEHFLEWKTVYPLKKNDTKSFYFDKVRSQEMIVQGMLEPANLVKIISHYILFKPLNKDVEIKIVCRYQQFRAVQKIIKRMRDNENPRLKSGVVWHTQGSGKSLTMVFLIREIRSSSDLDDLKILLVNDRTDLEEQLGETANLSGETPNYVESTSKLSILSGNASNLNLVMMHKFNNKNKVDNEKIQEMIDAGLLYEEDLLPEYEEYPVINESDRILILIDEAHRTQNNLLGLAGNLISAFPNATKVAFTGTPLLSDKHKSKTKDLFGGGQDYIDTYKARDSVNDGATLQIVYEGKYDKLAIKNTDEFQQEYEESFRGKTEAEKKEIIKKGSKWIKFFESDAHVEEVAKDVVNHYIEEILENGFKAQVVCVSRPATVKYKNYIDHFIKERIELEESKGVVDYELVRKLKFLKSSISISYEGNDPADMVRLSKESKKNKAVENFKKEFNYDNENTGIAFLIVCDKLLTGFDAPIEQVMYLDKRMKEHTLFQALTRVNRTYKGKTKGYIVDYAANATQVAETLDMYSGDDEKEEGFRAIETPDYEIGELENRYYQVVNFFKERKIKGIEKYLERTIDETKKEIEVFEQIMTLLEDEINREQFQFYVKKYLACLDIVIHKGIEKRYKQAMYSMSHLLARARERYKDETINLAGVGNKLKNLINKHLESKGLSLRIRPVQLFDDDFKDKIKEAVSPKAKASEMEHAIRKHIHLNRDLDPVLFESFLKLLETALELYSENMEARYRALEELMGKIKEGRKDDEGKLESQYRVFYDIICKVAFSGSCPEESEDDIASVVIKLVELIKVEIKKVNFWNSATAIERLEEELNGVLIMMWEVPEIFNKKDEIIKEFITLARNRHNLLVK